MNTEELRKYMAGDASQQEREAMQQWLERDERNRREFRSLRTLRDIELAHLSGEQANRAAGEKKNNRYPLTAWLRIAAAILITFGCTYFFLKPAPPDRDAAMQTLRIPAGQRAELMLADGTKVWLNSQTVFSFPARFSATSREVYLDGEAYLEVSHDPAKPFTVHTKPHDIQVLGTEFNVSAYASRHGAFELSLLKGSVRIVTPENGQTLQLEPGNRAYEKENRLVGSAIADYNHFLWKKGIISFDNERIEDILTKLQLYYDVEIRNGNSSVKDMRYTGKFRAGDGIEHVLNVLKIPTGLRYDRDDETDTIRIR
ncbi:MAG: FecR domain-containing protein [Tannerella sp.]|jgi:ferric-dicitrate binding protein FerR (iron transport regulator)|nr:FecR domain-containing protein [Tannerella sp.]